MKPLVGITCCNKPFGQFAVSNHAASDTYVRAVDGAVGAAPVLIPANGEAADIASLLARLDGILLTGSRSNVFPGLYGGPAHPDGTPEDRRRDGVTMALIRAAIARGLPLLGICRGMQEMNVALGGTLDQQVRTLPGRLDHRALPGDELAARIGKSHAVTVAPGSELERLVGVGTLAVNSLHEQGVGTLAPRLAIEAVAPDGTPEAVRVLDAPGFAIGVQWHPEYDWEADGASRAVFEGFGAAVRDYAAGRARA